VGLGGDDDVEPVARLSVGAEHALRDREEPPHDGRSVERRREADRPRTEQTLAHHRRRHRAQLGVDGVRQADLPLDPARAGAFDRARDGEEAGDRQRDRGQEHEGRQHG
jgi:hypothetical protein